MQKILLAFRNPSDGKTQNFIKDYDVDTMPTGQSPVEIQKQQRYDIILLEDRLSVLEMLKYVDPRVEVIQFDSSTDPVEAVKAGAYAHFDQAIVNDEVVQAIEQINSQMEIRKETAALEQVLSSKYQFQGIVGKNPNMLELFNFIRRIAPYYRSVTIIGETGTGKERIARAIHHESPLANRPFITLNCGGIVKELIESELFGHVKGSFTGAAQDKEGLFEAAADGTLFLDEIGTLPLSVQPHLLRVLQDGDFRRVGSNKTLKAKCRIVAATNVDLKEEVREGRFREDLYFRLAPLEIKLPPLRERKDDIPLLLRYFIEQTSKKIGRRLTGISRPAQKLLNSHDWPGNVRELENVIERAAILATETFIQESDLPPFAGNSHLPSSDTSLSLDEAIMVHIKAVLDQCNGNRSHACKKLGISRRSLLRKLEKYSLD